MLRKVQSKFWTRTKEELHINSVKCFKPKFENSHTQNKSRRPEEVLPQKPPVHCRVSR